MLLAALLSCVVPAAVLAQQAADAKSANKSAKTKAAAPAAQSGQKLDVAGAQSTIDSASKLLAAGKTEPAIAQLSTVISSGNLPAAVMARALHLRGSAYRQQSKPALAIADLTSALWLKGGLNETDRADATKQRAAAYGEAGLTEQGQAIASTTTKTKSATAATQAPAPAPSSGGLFAGLFGGSSSTAAPKEEAPIVQPAPKQAATRPASNWTAATKPAAAPAPAPAAPSQSIALAHTPSPAVAPSATGHLVTRVALVRTQAQAQEVVAKLMQKYASALGHHTADIGQATFGNMGSFFEVAIGPFKTADEAQAMCAKLKGSGLDCVPLNR